MGEVSTCPVEAKMTQREVLLLGGMCSGNQDGDHKGLSIWPAKWIGLEIQHKFTKDLKIDSFV